MNIIKAQIKFKEKLKTLKDVKYIVVHHIEASKASVGDIHQWHLNRGWFGIGYNFYIRKDGTIFECRGFNEGAQCKGYNDVSIGVALEGDFMKEEPTKQELKSLIELCKFLSQKYPNVEIKEHKELCDTDCAGINFDIFNVIKEVENEDYYKSKLIEIRDFIDEILEYGGV